MFFLQYVDEASKTNYDIDIAYTPDGNYCNITITQKLVGSSISYKSFLIGIPVDMVKLLAEHAQEVQDAQRKKVVDNEKH